MVTQKSKRYTVRLNNLDKIEQLLQETYNLASQQHTALQNEINKVANSTKLNELDIDGKEKYAKIMANYHALQQKSINQKQDIAKLMAEVAKHNGDIDGALSEAKKVATTIDIDALRKLATDASSKGDEKTITYQTK